MVWSSFKKVSFIKKWHSSSHSTGHTDVSPQKAKHNSFKMQWYIQICLHLTRQVKILHTSNTSQCYVHKNVCVCVCVCVRASARACVRVCEQARVRVCVHAPVFACVLLRARVHTRPRPCARAYVSVCLCSSPHVRAAPVIAYMQESELTNHCQECLNEQHTL